MKAELKYDELSEYIKKNYGQSVTFSYVDMKTLTATANVKLFVMPVSVPLTVHIESVIGTEVVLSYSGNFGVDAIVTSVLKFLGTRVSGISKILDYDGNHTIKMHLSEIEQLKPAFDVVTIKDVWFMREEIVMSLALK